MFYIKIHFLLFLKDQNTWQHWAHPPCLTLSRQDTSLPVHRLVPSCSIHVPTQPLRHLSWQSLEQKDVIVTTRDGSRDMWNGQNFGTYCCSWKTSLLWDAGSSWPFARRQSFISEHTNLLNFLPQGSECTVPMREFLQLITRGGTEWAVFSLTLYGLCYIMRLCSVSCCQRVEELASLEPRWEGRVLTGTSIIGH